MKKLIEVLKNPAMTIFMWIMAAACYLALWTNAVKHGDKAQIAVLILATIDAAALFIRYRK